jgi:integrase
MDFQIRRRGLSDRQIAALPKRPKRYVIPDPELRGHYVRVPPAGPNVFAAVARDPYGKQVWATLGAADVMKISDAREQARTAITRIKAGKPAVEPPVVKPDTFQAVAENWLKRHVEAKKLRSRDEFVRILRKYVYPFWGEREFVSIKRSDVAALLDHVEDNHGPRQADVVLSIIRAIANWQATRDDDYRSPFVRGMTRSDAHASRRDRILDDDELQKLWRVTGESGTFGALVRVLLLSGQRLAKVTTMKWSAVDVDGVWTIPTAAREKANAGKLQLPKLALDVIRAQPRMASNDHVFAGRSVGPINNMYDNKAALDRKLNFAEPWVLHNLRRTARSLMSRAGVQPHIAERVLGHAIKGIEGTYDRHAYDDEKSDALAKLARLIEIIINPPADNVRQLKRRR